MCRASITALSAQDARKAGNLSRSFLANFTGQVARVESGDSFSFVSNQTRQNESGRTSFPALGHEAKQTDLSSLAMRGIRKGYGTTHEQQQRHMQGGRAWALYALCEVPRFLS